MSTPEIYRYDGENPPVKVGGVSALLPALVPISYQDFMNLSQEEQESGSYIVTNMPTLMNAYSLGYKDGLSAGQKLDQLSSDLTELIQVNSGTTLSTLISAINALSDKEFFYSKLFLNNTEVLNPDNISSAAGREYSRWATAGTATQMQYGISRVDSGTSRCYVVQKATNGSYTATNVTVTNWKLYYIKDLSI